MFASKKVRVKIDEQDQRIKELQCEVNLLRKQLRGETEELEALLDRHAALVEAARPVVKAWKNKRAMLVRHGEMELNGECDDVCICASSMQLDALAALVGEEK